MIKKAKIMAVLVLLALCGSAWGSDGSGLIAHWEFDEGSGDTAYDSAGDNNGTVYGAMWTTGRIDGALDFDGTDDYVDIGDKLNNVDIPFSIAAWVNKNEGGNQGIFTSDDTRSGNYYGFWFFIQTDNALQISYGDGSGDNPPNRRSKISSSTIQNNTWTFVGAVVRGPTDMDLYIDGADAGGSYSGSGGDMAHNQYKAVIGWVSRWGPHRFNGSIDDVRIYDRALSAEEIQQLYQDGLAEVVGLEITGPERIAENFEAQYKAIARYDNNSTADVTDLAEWLVEPEAIAGIEAGVLQTEGIDRPEEDITIYAQYTEGEITVAAQKAVSVFAICPTGSVLDFDGTDDYVDIGDKLNNVDIPFSIAAWVNKNEGGNQGIFTSDDTGSGNYYGFWFFIQTDNALQISYGDGSGDNPPNRRSKISSSTIQNNTWTFVGAVVRGPTDMDLYIDGADAGGSYSGSGGDMVHNQYKAVIGRLSRWGPYYRFNGSIDDVRIYNKALSAEEILANMHTRPDYDDPNLVGYWDFDEGEGQIAHDLSGNGNDGQLGSTPETDDSDPEWVESDAPIGICTTRGFVERNISDVLEIKLNILEELEAALAKENTTIDMLEELFREREYGDLNKGEILAVKKNVHLAIQDEERLRKPMEKSVGKLQDSLSALGCEPVQE